jgi:hypothetical protein
MALTLWIGFKVLAGAFILIAGLCVVADYFTNQRWHYEKRPWLYAIGLVLSLLVWAYFIGWFIQLPAVQ